jgi:hypothetical protein
MGDDRGGIALCSPVAISGRRLGIGFAILAVFREAGESVGVTIAIAGPGESLLRVRHPDALSLVLKVMPDLEHAISLEEALNDGRQS